MSAFFDYPDGPHGDDAPHGEQLVMFAGLSPSEWDLLAEAMERRRFAEAAVVMRNGEIDRSLYLVTAGSVEIFVGDARDERSVGVRGPGTILGEVAFFDGQERSATVRAVTATEVLRLGPEAFDSLAARHPDLGRKILLDLGRVLAVRLRRAQGHREP